MQIADGAKKASSDRCGAEFRTLEAGKQKPQLLCWQVRDLLNPNLSTAITRW